MANNRYIRIFEGAFNNNAGKWPLGIIYVDTNYWGDDSLSDKYGWGDDSLHQEIGCISFCEKYSVGIANESMPGGNFRYKNPSEVLAYCQGHKNEVNMLIVARRDCLSMNTAEYLRYKIALLKLGVEIVSIEDTEFIDSSMDEICKIVAEYQRDSTVKEANKIV